MGKLSQMVFDPQIQKEYELKGHKIVLKSLTTKDTVNLEYTVDGEENPNVQHVLKAAIELLSTSLVSIDGEKPDNLDEARLFFVNQTPNIVFEFLNKYREMNQEVEGEIKN